MDNNIIIIGAGPAGMSCAIQLRRYGLKPVIIEKNTVGGLLGNANLVENYPGFPGGLTGTALVDKFNEHIKKYNLSPVFDEVCKVKFNDPVFVIKTKKSEYKAKFLVIASGTKPKKFNMPVFYEVCDLFKQDLKDKRIAIIGAGDAAFDYALNIADNSPAREVFILNRGTKTKCIPVLKQRALQNPKITYIENAELNENNEYDYFLAAIGREANMDFINPDALNAPGIYLIGDVKNGHFRQTAIAAGDGIRTAMEIYKKINS